MHSIKSAADALKNSPRVMRKKFGQITGKHECLEDDIMSIRENLPDGITFPVKKLGCLPVQYSQGSGCTDVCVEELVATTKKSKAKSNKTLQKLLMVITPDKVQFKDIEKDLILEVLPLYRMSYCTADQRYPKVFAFIARPAGSEELYCHAFLTHKSSMAEAIALTIAEAFAMSYEAWEAKNFRKKNAVDRQCDEDAKNLYKDVGTKEAAPKCTASQPGKEDIQEAAPPRRKATNHSNLVDDEEDADDLEFIFHSLHPTEVVEEFVESDDEFKRLAEERSQPSILCPSVKRNSLKAKGVSINDFMSFKDGELEASRSMEDLSDKVGGAVNSWDGWEIITHAHCTKLIEVYSMAASETNIDEKFARFSQFLEEVKEIEKRDADLTNDKQIDRLTKPGSKYLNLNPYEVLQISPKASEEEIKKSYKKLSILVHPDKNYEKKEMAQKAFEAVNSANKLLKDADQVKKIKHVLEEADATVQIKLKEKRKEAKKLGIETIEEDTDPEKYCKFRRGVTAKLFADYEIRRLQLEERTQSERKRERDAEIAVEEETKAKKEWQKNWDEGRNERVDSWRSFQTSKKKSEKKKATKSKPKLFKPPSLKPEKR
eukprot:gene255-876_t